MGKDTVTFFMQLHLQWGAAVIQSQEEQRPELCWALVQRLLHVTETGLWPDAIGSWSVAATKMRESVLKKLLNSALQGFSASRLPGNPYSTPAFPFPKSWLVYPQTKEVQSIIHVQAVTEDYLMRSQCTLWRMHPLEKCTCRLLMLLLFRLIN